MKRNKPKKKESRIKLRTDEEEEKGLMRRRRR